MDVGRGVGDCVGAFVVTATEIPVTVAPTVTPSGRRLDWMTTSAVATCAASISCIDAPVSPLAESVTSAVY